MTQVTSPINFLYQEIEKLHGAAPWGDVLDAGTGSQSLNWLLSLNTDSCTAVTGAQGMAASVKTKLGDRLRAQDQIIVGNWKDETLLKGQQYDYVIADYLLGAIEGFAPYWQDCLFDRLHPLVKKRLYFVGLEPYVPYYPKSVAGKMVCEIGRLRDACLLLANERPYREFPLDWVLRHMYHANYRVLEVKQYGIKYGERFIHSQLNMCVQRMQKIENQALATSMLAHIEALRERALQLTAEQDGLQYGFDYVIVAEPL